MKKFLAFVCSVALIGASLGITPTHSSAADVDDSMKYDINGDSSITVKDLAAMKNLLLGIGASDQQLNGDVNKDGKINIIDFIYLKSFFMGTDYSKQDIGYVNVDEITYGNTRAAFSEKEKSYYYTAALFKSYQQMLDYIEEADKDHVDLSNLTATYTEEFFEKQCVVLSFTNSIIEPEYFESAQVSGSTLSLNFFDSHHSEPMPWLNYVTVTLDKSELEGLDVQTAKYCTNEVEIPQDEISIECISAESVYSVDEWFDSQEKLAGIFTDQTDRDYYMQKYDSDFFEDNVILAATEAIKTSSTEAYYDNEFFSMRIYGDSVEDIYLTLIAVPRKYYDARKVLVSSRYTNVAYKPAVYLYPEEETEVTVSVDLNGDFTCVYPEFTDPDTSTWKVTANPDGTLYTEDGSQYSYLFWEGTQKADWDMSEGFIVRGCDTLAFLKKQLPLMGLTPKEYNDFIVYWLPQMQNNGYNYITFQTDSYTDNAVLNVTPQADSVLRVFMAYMPVNEKEAQTLKETTQEPVFDSFSRDGFTVVEWGGTKISR
ncbi:MAG: dockerin type I domain-containing protein [Oscillospiraceae bacterium]|nr:dockerin type I domain-containing protein [Oscillospiraceae bacterium]